MSWIEYDTGLIEDIAARMDLRAPNKAAISKVIEEIKSGEYHEVICDLATGVGKTYITAGLIDYLAEQGVRNILIVTPGRTIQEKTIANFTPGHRKFVPGADRHGPEIITAENFARGQVGDALHDPERLKIFVFNVQQLIKPSAKTSRKVREVDEFIGADLYSHLQKADDLVVLADEHHVYRSQAKVFASAVRDLEPRALVGLTATPDKADTEKIIYQYTLAEAIADHLVKIPVIVYRQDGHKGVETQLRDAAHLLRVKAAAWKAWAETEGEEQVNPVLFVVCQTIEEAKDTAEVLARPGFIGNADAVLEVTSQSSDEALDVLAQVEEPNSLIRAVVSVDKLKEGWDVKNIGVIVALRKLASESLTEQILGRGLRLPFGRRVGVQMIDTVDLVAHDSYKKLLDQKDILSERILPAPTPASETAGSGPDTTSRGEWVGGEAGGSSDTGGDASPGGGVGPGTWEQNALRLRTGTHIVNGEEIGGTTGLLIQNFDEAIATGETEKQKVTKLLEPVAGSPAIHFPRRQIKLLPVRFSLSIVSNADAKSAGAAYKAEVNVQLVRRALTAERGVDGEAVMRQVGQKAEIATQEYRPVERVKKDLEDRVLGLGLVESNLQEYNATKRVVAAFMEGAGVNLAEVTETHDMLWGEARAQHAANGIGRLIQDKYNNRRMQPEYEFYVVQLPPHTVRAMPTDVDNDPYNAADKEKFERGRYYGGWQKSIMPVASFDARTTEARLAHVLDESLAIDWWYRLSTQEAAYIELADSKKYYPDFIAIDTNGVHWLIEGKSDHEAGRDDVRAKRHAAEEWARYVTDDGQYGSWRYLFVTEKHLADSRNNWESLLIAASPE
jgi:type III restriction enzyme